MLQLLYIVLYYKVFYHKLKFQLNMQIGNIHDNSLHFRATVLYVVHMLYI